MGFGKFLKKVALAPLKATKKTAQLAHKATIAPLKATGIVKGTQKKSTQKPILKAEKSEPALKAAVQKAQKSMPKRKSLGGFKSL